MQSIRFRNFFTLALTLVVVVGCSALGTGGATTPGYSVPGSLPERANWADLVDFAEWVSHQDAATLEPLHQEALARDRAGGAPLDKLNLALLLSTPDMPFQDDREAMQILEAGLAATENSPGNVRDFMRLQKIALDNRLALQGRVSASQAETRALEQQLEQLKSIERTLIERRERLESP